MDTLHGHPPRVGASAVEELARTVGAEEEWVQIAEEAVVRTAVAAVEIPAAEQT